MVDSAGQEALKQVRKAFDELSRHEATTQLTRQWIDAYRKRRPERAEQRPRTEVQAEPRNVPTPHEIQQEALKALEETRASGNTAGLVVLATGLGKTWLAAFDTNRPEYRRVLFVAHREEILNQSRDTFRRIRPDARLGFYKGGARGRRRGSLRLHPDARPRGPPRALRPHKADRPATPGTGRPVSFHPKAYVFARRDGTGVAFVAAPT